MTEAEYKPFVRLFFATFGIDVADIPRSSDETPDFEIHGANDSSLVELKIKGDDPEEQKADSEVLGSGQVLSKSKSLSKRNRLSGIIRKGCDQLVSHDPTHQKFHFLWLHSAGVDADLHFEQFRATLLGTQKLISMDLEGMPECFYFHSCDFFRFRDVLDGAFISQGEDVTFCVNSLSPLIARLRLSRLYVTLKEGVLDPDILEASKICFIADAAAPRDSEQAMLEHLRVKYGLEHLQSITFGRHTAAIAVRDAKKG